MTNIQGVKILQKTNNLYHYLEIYFIDAEFDEK